MAGRKARRPRRRRRGIWGEAIRDRFLKLVEETGNVSAALRIIGHPSMFYKRRRRDPVFARQWAEAVAAADARLSKAESPIPDAERAAAAGRGTGTGTSTCPEVEAAGMGTGTSTCPSALLRPAPKRKPAKRGHVIRRAANGRVQIALAHEGHMTAELEADFLARLRATGNFNGSARALGFQPNSLYQRMREWPAFARACEEALREASVMLDFALVAHAHKLLREPGEARAAGIEEEETPFDPATAMRIISFIDARKYGRTTRGPRKGPPERTFQQAVASVLAKIAAIERHEKMKQEREQDGRATPPPAGAGDERPQ